MRSDCVRMSLKRAATFVEKITDDGEKENELVGKLEKTTTRAVIRMAKMTVTEIDQLCGSLILVSECKDLTQGEKRTFEKLHDHAMKYIGGRNVHIVIADEQSVENKPTTKIRKKA